MMKLVASGVLAAVLLSGCAQESPIIDFPEEANQAALTQTATAPPTSSSPSPTATWTGDEAAAIAALRKFLGECLPAAQADPMKARVHLEPCAVDDMVNTSAASIGKHLDAGYTREGPSTIEVITVREIAEGAIEVDVCLDQSQVKTFKTEDGGDVEYGQKYSRTMGAMIEDGTWVAVGSEDRGESHCDA